MHTNTHTSDYNGGVSMSGNVASETPFVMLLSCFASGLLLVAFVSQIILAVLCVVCGLQNADS